MGHTCKGQVRNLYSTVPYFNVVPAVLEGLAAAVHCCQRMFCFGCLQDLLFWLSRGQTCLLGQVCSRPSLSMVTLALSWMLRCKTAEFYGVLLKNHYGYMVTQLPMMAREH